MSEKVKWIKTKKKMFNTFMKKWVSYDEYIKYSGDKIKFIIDSTYDGRFNISIYTTRHPEIANHSWQLAFKSPNYVLFQDAENAAIEYLHERVTAFNTALIDIGSLMIYRLQIPNEEENND